MEKRERILALAAVEIVRNCCGSLSLPLSLSYFSSLCEEEVWRITFFVVSCVSNFPLDSDNGRTCYMLRVMAVVRAAARHQVRRHSQ
jgi:hypothetical protein